MKSKSVLPLVAAKGLAALPCAAVGFAAQADVKLEADWTEILIDAHAPKTVEFAAGENGAKQCAEDDSQPIHAARSFL